ncbi:hypothetical protein [Lacrimispora brassicae]
MVESGNIDALVRALEEQRIACNIFSGISGEPGDAVIAAGPNSYQGEKCNFLIALKRGVPPIPEKRWLGMMWRRFSTVCGIENRIKEKKYGISKNEGIAESGFRKEHGGWSLQCGKP